MRSTQTKKAICLQKARKCVLSFYISLFNLSTAQRIFAIKIRRTKTQTAVSQDYLLGGRALCAQAVDIFTDGGSITSLNKKVV